MRPLSPAGFCDSEGSRNSKEFGVALMIRVLICCRRSTIIPQFVGFKFEVHNGKDFIPLKVSEDMVRASSHI